METSADPPPQPPRKSRTRFREVDADGVVQICEINLDRVSMEDVGDHAESSRPGDGAGMHNEISKSSLRASSPAAPSLPPRTPSSAKNAFRSATELVPLHMRKRSSTPNIFGSMPSGAFQEPKDSDPSNTPAMGAAGPGSPPPLTSERRGSASIPLRRVGSSRSLQRRASPFGDYGDEPYLVADLVDAENVSEDEAETSTHKRLHYSPHDSLNLYRPPQTFRECPALCGFYVASGAQIHREGDTQYMVRVESGTVASAAAIAGLRRRSASADTAARAADRLDYPLVGIRSYPEQRALDCGAPALQAAVNEQLNSAQPADPRKFRLAALVFIKSTMDLYALGLSQGEQFAEERIWALLRQEATEMRVRAFELLLNLAAHADLFPSPEGPRIFLSLLNILQGMLKWMVLVGEADRDNLVWYAALRTALFFMAGFSDERKAKVLPIEVIREFALRFASRSPAAQEVLITRLFCAAGFYDPVRVGVEATIDGVTKKGTGNKKADGDNPDQQRLPPLLRGPKPPISTASVLEVSQSNLSVPTPQSDTIGSAEISATLMRPSQLLDEGPKPASFGSTPSDMLRKVASFHFPSLSPEPRRSRSLSSRRASAASQIHHAASVPSAPAEPLIDEALLLRAGGVPTFRALFERSGSSECSRALFTTMLVVAMSRARRTLGLQQWSPNLGWQMNAIYKVLHAQVQPFTLMHLFRFEMPDFAEQVMRHMFFEPLFDKPVSTDDHVDDLQNAVRVLNVWLNKKLMLSTLLEMQKLATEDRRKGETMPLPRPRWGDDVEQLESKIVHCGRAGNTSRALALVDEAAQRLLGESDGADAINRAARLTELLLAIVLEVRAGRHGVAPFHSEAKAFLMGARTISTASVDAMPSSVLWLLLGALAGPGSSDPSEPILMYRSELRQALEELVAIKCVPQLIKLSDDPDAQVAERACRALVTTDGALPSGLHAVALQLLVRNQLRADGLALHNYNLVRTYLALRNGDGVAPSD